MAFASPLHPRGEWEGRLKGSLKALEEAGLTVSEVVLVTSRDEAVEAARALRGEREGVVAIILTGGSSKLAATALMDLRAPLVMAAYERQNSLPSALEAASMLRRRGRPRIVVLDRGASDVASLLKESHDVRGRVRSRMALIGGAPALLEEAGFDEASSRLGVEVVEVGLDRVRRGMEGVEPGELKALSSELRAEVGQVEGPLRLYLATRRVLEDEGFDGVAFNCFSLLRELKATPCIAVSMLSDEGFIAVCEAEVQATVASIIAHRCLEAKPFISNVSAVGGDHVVLAHCTAPRSMGTEYALATHFESGLPMALNVKLRPGEVTLYSLDKDLSSIVALRGVAVESMLGVEGMCRTQVKVRVEGAERLVDMLPGGHLVMVYGDRVGELERVARGLRLRLQVLA